MAEFSPYELLVEPEQARERITERIQALQDCPDDGRALTEWFDTTMDVLDAIYVSGAKSYFDKNSGFKFIYSINRPKRLNGANRDRAIGILRKLYSELPKRYNESNSHDFAIFDPVNEEISLDVFVVHGHSEAHITEVARTLERLELNPVILREKANKGATIIEKFETNANVGFAVVIMTADDMGGKAHQNIDEIEFRPRARQNVILELGYFVGALGRARVCVLKSPDVDAPSDILGVVYTPLDDAGRWKFDLVKELKAAGYKVSADSII